MRRLLSLLLLLLTLLTHTARAQPVAPELTPNRGWLNTDRPLRFSDELKGHVVVLDFWTYCCINCMHVLPDLEFLEEKYADDPVIVIGVHSAKFASEGERKAVRDAVFRYDIHHPVVIDDEMRIWRKYGVRAWPSFVVIGTEGRAVRVRARDGGFDYAPSGEGHRDALDEAIAGALAAGRERATIAKERFRVQPDASVDAPGGLAYPGKVLADRKTDRLFIADSSNDRVIICTFPDERGASRAVRIVGDGERGLRDGPPDKARFHDPQGLALDPAGAWLYVADTRNHAVRRIRLDDGTVETVAGNGAQSSDRTGGKAGAEQGLSSPWAIAFSADGQTLFVAMAGTHQLWRIDVASGVARVLAGSGRENILDGSAARAQLAQPSALAMSRDGRTLYFADSETSSIRSFDLDAAVVRTHIGEGLFEFGDVDGPWPKARLQHPLGLALIATPDGDRLLVADTYNSKLKLIDPVDRSSRTWQAGTGVDLREPAGVSVSLDEQGHGHVFVADTNNQRIVVIDVPGGATREVIIDGLVPPGERQGAEGAGASIGVVTGRLLTLTIDPKRDDGQQPNPEAPTTVRVSDGETGRVLLQRTSRVERFPITIEVPADMVIDGAVWHVEVSYALCEGGDHAVCIPADAAWTVRIERGDATTASLNE